MDTAAQTEAGLGRKLKLKLKLAIHRSKRSGNGDDKLDRKKGRIFTGRKAAGREERRSIYNKVRSAGVGGGERGQKGFEVEKSTRTIWGPVKCARANSKDKKISRREKARISEEAERRREWKLKKDAEDELLQKVMGKRRRTNLSRRLVEKGNAENVADQKERKRIRIHHLDASNKRIDDVILSSENIKTKTKKEDEKNVTLSKNAQFRAIRPSPSILSFVDENLLGRRRLIELRRAGYNIDIPAPLDNIPNSTNPERERIEENVFRNKLDFFAAAKVSSSFPIPDLPEVAVAGRSNVGKSSLLNALTRQWGVVRTSDQPGHTQTINFFRLGKKLNLVDLPGYGFAYAEESVKDAWEELVKEYVSTRIGINRVCLLIDTKWGMKPRDHELIELMEKSKTKYQVVLTKTDAVPPIDVARRAMQIQENLKANSSVMQPVMMVSSKTGAGIRCLRTVLANIGRFVKI